MQVNVDFLENLKLQARFDDFKVLTDQPIRYKGDGMAPGPYDYFLASSALCAAYFVKVYCKARNIPTDDIRLQQQNIVDPDNRYHQDLHIQVELPSSISEKDKQGIIASMERCTVKRVIQNAPKFKIEAVETLGSNEDLYTPEKAPGSKTLVPGKDSSLEETIEKMTSLLTNLGINIEIASWRNQVPHVWSVHIRDADSPICFSNGKGASKDAALCSALGEFIERLSCNYFYNDFAFGSEISKAKFVHYPNEKWFALNDEDKIPEGLMDKRLLDLYNPNQELKGSHLIDNNSGNKERGICALPFTRQSDNKTIYIPVNVLGNLYVSNGMSAGNTKYEARVQCLSEIFERAVKNEIILGEYALPDVPQSVLDRYPTIIAGIQKLEEAGFPIVVKDASLGGKFPVMCVTLMNPKNGGVFASFGAHPKFEVALERSLTELLQGRSFEGMNDTFPPTFSEYAVQEHNNIVEHFIDSTGVISWKFFSSEADYQFSDWNFEGNTEEEFNYLMDIMAQIEKEVYIADYDDLGANACRIIVPDYSEIYQIDDLIWENNNLALEYRADILNLHQLNNTELSNLVEKLEESELDDFMPIGELIGIAFDDASAWEQLVVGELKAMIYLALKQFELAKGYTDTLNTFNDHTIARKKFFRLLNILLDIEIREDLKLEDYSHNLAKMYGANLLKDVENCINGSEHFYGLVEIGANFEGLDKQQRLIASYQKLLQYRWEN